VTSNLCLPKAGTLALAFTANETRYAPHAGSSIMWHMLLSTMPFSAILSPVIALLGRDSWLRPFLFFLHLFDNFRFTHTVRAFDELWWDGALEAVATITLIVISFGDTSSFSGALGYGLIFRLLIIGVIMVWHVIGIRRL
jgi:hypothetical protein